MKKNEFKELGIKHYKFEFKIKLSKIKEWIKKLTH